MPPERLETKLVDQPATPPLAVYERRWFWWGLAGLAVVLMGAAGLLVAYTLDSQKAAKTPQAVITTPLSTEERAKLDDPPSLASDLAVTNLAAENAEMGRLLVRDSLRLTPSLQPATGEAGQLYYDQTSNQLAYYNGTQFVSLGAGGTTNVTNLQVTNVTNNSTATGAATVVGGTAGRLARFTGAQTLGDSLVTDTGAGISVNGNVNLVSASFVGAETTVFTPSSTPVTSGEVDPQAIEVGMKFRSDVNGLVRGVRFYKDALNIGTHVGSLWTTGGVKLATVTFTDETASGWQEARFSTPVAIGADTTYVISYHMPNGYYAVNLDYFAPSGVDNGPLHALQDGVDGGNGVFRYAASSSYPNTTFRSNNYWVDVIFTPLQNPAQYQVDGAQLSSFNLSNNGDLAKRSSSQVFTGYNTFRSAVNSSAAFKIQSADTTTVLQIDTDGLAVFLGGVPATGSPTLLVLSKKISAGDPGGGEGAMYYSMPLRQLRCYREGTWSNCSEPMSDYEFSLRDEFMGGSPGIGSLGWAIQGIGGAGGTISYNPAAPAPVADRPGVLALQTPAAAGQGTTFTLAAAGSGSMLIRDGNVLKTAVAVGATTGQVLRVGLHGQTTATTQPVSGVWWEADPAVSANWRYCYGTGSAAVCAASTTPIAADSWARLAIRVTATGTNTSAASFVIDGSAWGVGGVTIDTTNRIAPAYSCYTTTATARDCYWDYFQLFGTTAAR